MIEALKSVWFKIPKNILLTFGLIILGYITQRFFDNYFYNQPFLSLSKFLVSLIWGGIFLIGYFLISFIYFSLKLISELQNQTALEQNNQIIKLEFKERQYREFYSPMIACLKEIKAKNLITVKVSKASSEAWRELCANSPRPMPNHDKEFEPYKKSIEYANKQLEQEILPLYNKMLSIFSEKYGLANSEIQKGYDEFCEFVEIWNRWITHSIAVDTIEKLDHREKKLFPFYDELEKQTNILRKHFD